jgi:hypothetical protein
MKFDYRGSCVNFRRGRDDDAAVFPETVDAPIQPDRLDVSVVALAAARGRAIAQVNTRGRRARARRLPGAVPVRSRAFVIAVPDF